MLALTLNLSSLALGELDLPADEDDDGVDSLPPPLPPFFLLSLLLPPFSPLSYSALGESALVGAFFGVEGGTFSFVSTSDDDDDNVAAPAAPAATGSVSSCPSLC